MAAYSVLSSWEGGKELRGGTCVCKVNYIFLKRRYINPQPRRVFIFKLKLAIDV